MAAPNGASLNITDSLARFTSPALIVPRLRGQDPAAVMQELSMVLQQQGRIPDLLPFYHAALNREFLCCTAVGDGFAYPHARLNGIPELSFAFGMLQQPICWNKSSSSSVTMVFLSAVPASDAAAYLALVSGFAGLARDRESLRNIQTAQDAREILDVFQQVKLRTASRPVGITAF